MFVSSLLAGQSLQRTYNWVIPFQVAGYPAPYTPLATLLRLAMQNSSDNEQAPSSSKPKWKPVDAGATQQQSTTSLPAQRSPYSNPTAADGPNKEESRNKSDARPASEAASIEDESYGPDSLFKKVKIDLKRLAATKKPAVASTESSPSAFNTSAARLSAQGL